jgi:hypothetical protein
MRGVLPAPFFYSNSGDIGGSTDMFYFCSDNSEFCHISGELAYRGIDLNPKLNSGTQRRSDPAEKCGQIA